MAGNHKHNINKINSIECEYESFERNLGVIAYIFLASTLMKKQLPKVGYFKQNFNVTNVVRFLNVFW